MQSLIRREGILIVVDDGRRQQAEEGGDNAANARPSRHDRILVVAPNYVVE